MGSYKLPNGRVLNLMYNGIALLRLREGDAVKRIVADDEALLEVASALAKGGELWNRYMGFEPMDIPTIKCFEMLNKEQLLKLRLTVLKIIVDGAGKSDNNEDEYEDVVLNELNARTKQSETELLDELFSLGSLAGLKPKESLLLPIKTLNKLAENATKRGGFLFPWAAK